MSRETDVQEHEYGVELTREYQGEEYRLIIPSDEIVDVTADILKKSEH